MPANLDDLKASLDSATAKLADVEQKKMFGCPAYFHNERIFAMVWKHGRIAVKLPDEKLFDEAMSMKGAERWAPNGKSMGAWVLVAPKIEEDAAALKSWVTKAHKLAAEHVPEKPKKKKATAKKK